MGRRRDLKGSRSRIRPKWRREQLGTTRLVTRSPTRSEGVCSEQPRQCHDSNAEGRGIAGLLCDGPNAARAHAREGFAGRCADDLPGSRQRCLITEEWFQCHEFHRLGRMSPTRRWTSVQGNCVSPVRQYLGGLRSDGKRRVGIWLSYYLGAEGDKEYLSRIGTMFLVAMVARVMKPGVSVITCSSWKDLRARGNHRRAKSSAASGSATACPIFAAEKTSQHRKPQIGLFEVAEMSALDKARSRRAEGLRYEIRRAIPAELWAQRSHRAAAMRFCHTTNKAVYVRDETGGRRFWPVKVGGN